MTVWEIHNVDNDLCKISKRWKIFRAKMMKFNWNLLFTKGLYNNPGTLVSLLGTSLTVFIKLLVNIFRLLIFIMFGIFRAKMEKYGREISLCKGIHSNLNALMEPSRDLPGNFYKRMVIFFWVLVFIIFGTKMKKWWWDFVSL